MEDQIWSWPHMWDFTPLQTLKQTLTPLERRHWLCGLLEDWSPTLESFGSLLGWRTENEHVSFIRVCVCVCERVGARWQLVWRGVLPDILPHPSKICVYTFQPDTLGNRNKVGTSYWDSVVATNEWLGWVTLAWTSVTATQVLRRVPLNSTSSSQWQ